jgi:hypothetical protein
MRRAGQPLADAADADAAVTLRYAVFDDAPDLLRLAQLDSAEPPREPVLVAEVSGRLTAALSLSEDRIVADPFVLTAGTIELLRARARQLGGAARERVVATLCGFRQRARNVNGGLGRSRCGPPGTPRRPRAGVVCK